MKNTPLLTVLLLLLMCAKYIWMWQAQKIKPNKNHNKGFSLLELLIILIIFGVLISFAYPSYMQHLVTVRRINAAAVLVDLAGRMEQFYIRSNSYAGATLEQLGTNDTNYKNYYHIMIKTEANTYLLTAFPLGSQAQSDQLCGALSLDQDGQKSTSGYGAITDCWP